MFLHAGAGLHGHEYSSRQPNTNTFLRSSMRRISDDNRRFSSPLAPSAVDKARLELQTANGRPLSLPPTQLSPTDRLHRRDHSVRFEDELRSSQASTPVQSEDEESIAGSDCTATTSVSGRRRRRRRTPRKATRYALAQPAPVLRTRQRKLVQFRPKLLLQLQEIGEKRATPTFDVVPSSHIAGTLIIPVLAKRFPRLFGAKPDLGHDDFLLVRSEDYSSPDEFSSPSNSAVPGLGQRDVLAIVSTKPGEGDDHADIILPDGSTWSANGIANGSYEVTKLEGGAQPTTGRWVRKAATSRNRSDSNASSDPSTSTSSVAGEQRWTFSIMDRSARRHPIMGVLNSTELEVYDTYTSLSPSSGRYPPCRSFGAGAGGDARDASPAPSAIREERATLQVSEEHKSLMLASAAWINLCQQGWPSSANPKCSKALSHYRNSLADYPKRSSTFPGSFTDSSSDATTKRSSDAGIFPEAAAGKATPSPADVMPRRSVSAASHLLRRKKQAASNSFGSTGDGPDAQKTLQHTPSRGPMVRMVHWFRNCFGDGAANEPKNPNAPYV